MKRMLVTVAMMFLCQNAQAANQIKGNYAYVGIENCIISATFDANFNATAGQTFEQHSIVQGFANFDGSGSGSITVNAVSAPDNRALMRTGPFLTFTEYASQSQGTVNFTYSVNADGATFVVNESPGTNIGSITEGGSVLAGSTYLISNVPPWNGYISGGTGRNHTLLMATSILAIEVQTFSSSLGSTTFQAICGRERTLTKLDTDDTN